MHGETPYIRDNIRRARGEMAIKLLLNLIHETDGDNEHDWLIWDVACFMLETLSSYMREVCRIRVSDFEAQ